ncbi:MAG: hypothetical protein LIO96_03345 [Lachnospiraceae bacterium]|nr:hypothetical protein [Lachnospiraceae bacterium]
MNSYEIDQKGESRISFIGILFAAYAAITPIHQALLTSSGSTINKYLAILIMIMIIIEALLNGGILEIDSILLRNAIMFLGWIILTAVWSVSHSSTIASLTTIGSDIIFFLLCSGYAWTAREKS